MVTWHAMVAGFGTLAVPGSVAFMLWVVRRKADWHLRVVAMGARYGREFLGAGGMLAVTSGLTWRFTSSYAHFWRWETAMWLYALSVSLLAVFVKLSTFRRGNTSINWRGPQEASVHIKVARLTPGEIRSFLMTAPDIWMCARNYEIRRFRMLSPLFYDGERCERFAERAALELRARGVPCQVELLGTQTWSWWTSALFFLQHDRKSRCPHKQAQSLFQRAFRVKVGGFRLLLDEM